MAIYRVDVRFNMQNLGSGVNVFWFEWGNVENPTSFLGAVTDWVESMYEPLVGFIDSGCVFADAQVVSVDVEGETIEVIGSITPNISGTSNTEQLPSTSAASAMARTGTPKVQGRKRIPGIVEGAQIDALFTNPIVTAMAQFVVAWILGPAGFGLPDAVAGVLSSKLLDFAGFSGSGTVTNVPGTQVTRKPLRGL